MERIKVESSIIAEIGYDRKTRLLEIKFREGRVAKQYMEVSESTYNHLITCTSVGQFFQRYIGGRYEEKDIPAEE